MKLSTIMAIMTAAGMGAAQQDNVENIIQGPLNQVREIATQFEMRTIRTAVMNEIILDNMDVVERDFSEFVRSIAHSNAKDVAKDHWGTTYELQKTKKGYTIASAGKDMTFDTRDDLVVTVKTR